MSVDTAIQSIERALGEAVIPKRRKPRKQQVYRKIKPVQLTPLRRLLIKRFLESPPSYEIPKATKEPPLEEVARAVAQSIENTFRSIFRRYLADLLRRLDEKLFLAEAILEAQGRKTISDSRTEGDVTESVKVTYTDLVSFKATKVFKRDKLLSRVVMEYYSPINIAPEPLFMLLNDPAVLKHVEALLFDTVETFAEEHEGGLMLPQLQGRVEDYIFKNLEIEEYSTAGGEVRATVALDSGYGDLNITAVKLRINISLDFDATASILWPGEEALTVTPPAVAV